MIAFSQTRDEQRLTWAQLRDRVARARAGLRRLGVGRGDRVVAYLPNIPETVVAFLATASLGAVWASCAPEFGARSVVDRFGQVEPTVLLAVPGYGYGTRHVDRRDQVAELRAGLPTLRHVVGVPYGARHLPDTLGWDELLGGEPGDPARATASRSPIRCACCSPPARPAAESDRARARRHPARAPQESRARFDLAPGDTMLWFSTTAWMMWNALVTGCWCATIVTSTGTRCTPARGAVGLAEETGATHGGPPRFPHGLPRGGAAPGRGDDLSSLRQSVRQVAAAPGGFPLADEQLGHDVLVNVGSGGTDVCSGILQGSPLPPV